MRVSVVLPLLALLAYAAPLDRRELHNADFSRGPATTPLSLAPRAQSIVFNGVIQGSPSAPVLNGCKRQVSADTPLRVSVPANDPLPLNFNLNCDSEYAQLLSSPNSSPQSLADLSLKRQIPTLPLPLPGLPSLPKPPIPSKLATTKRQLPPLPDLPLPGLPVPVPPPLPRAPTVDSDNF